MEQAVLVLKRGDGADRDRALDLCGGMVGDAAVAHLPFRDQALHLGPGLLDRRRRVGVVELHQVEAVPPQPTQAGVHVRANRLGPEVHTVAPPLVGERAALREDEDVVTPRGL